MLNINELTIGDLREIRRMFPEGVNAKSDNVVQPYSPWEIGKTYLIRTVTMTDTGVLIAVTPQELVLKDAAWIADTGRFADALKSAQFNEVEPFPDGKVIIGRGSIIDAVEIKASPRSQK